METQLRRKVGDGYVAFPHYILRPELRSETLVVNVEGVGLVALFFWGRFDYR